VPSLHLPNPSIDQRRTHNRATLRRSRDARADGLRVVAVGVGVG
jgi:hypothetical protein